MKACLSIACILLFTYQLGAQEVVIASEDFENSSMFFTKSGGDYFSGMSGSSSRPAGSPYYSNGSYSVGVTNGTLTLTSSVLDLSDYTDIYAQFRLAAFSLTSDNGMDASDYVSFRISTDSGSTYPTYVFIRGNNNCYWSYSGGMGIASTVYPTYQAFQPSGGGNRTSDGYSTVKITDIPAQTGVSIQIYAIDNSSERWVIDEFRLIGTPEQNTPVILTSFTAMLDPSNHIRLTWVTQSETGMLGYYILRGNENDLALAELISPLIPASNSSQQQSYVFTDADPGPPGDYYYWLQSADLDGSSGFHGPQVAFHEPWDQSYAPSIPLKTDLQGVFPNPFNPHTLISYSLEKASDVRFQIHNARGQLVRSFVLGTQESGSHRLAWDGKDEQGRHLGSGIYYIRMTVGKDCFQRKAVLLK